MEIVTNINKVTQFIKTSALSKIIKKIYLVYYYKMNKNYYSDIFNIRSFELKIFKFEGK